WSSVQQDRAVTLHPDVDPLKLFAINCSPGSRSWGRESTLSLQLVEVQGHPPGAVRWADAFLLADQERVGALATISIQVANALKLALPDPTVRHSPTPDLIL